ncbi:MAG TPA: hypothetical protein DCY86_07985 [Bdellovibrionales bacterium]|nr:hypothetical protein [Bdellovibrionales bacterium]
MKVLEVRMLAFSKAMRNAVMVMSHLTEAYYDSEMQPISSSDIAATKEISRPLAAKTLTVLAQFDLVVGSTGPGGGYRLSRPPEQISLYEVMTIFRNDKKSPVCPFGSLKRNHTDPCPLQKRIDPIFSEIYAILKKTNLSIYKGHNKIAKKK